jgi:hypothetical protein
VFGSISGIWLKTQEKRFPSLAVLVDAVDDAGVEPRRSRDVGAIAKRLVHYEAHSPNGLEEVYWTSS